MLDFTKRAIAVVDGKMSRKEASGELLREAVETHTYLGVEMYDALETAISTLGRRRNHGLPDYPTQDELDRAKQDTLAALAK